MRTRLIHGSLVAIVLTVPALCLAPAGGQTPLPAQITSSDGRIGTVPLPSTTSPLRAPIVRTAVDPSAYCANAQIPRYHPEHVLVRFKSTRSGTEKAAAHTAAGVLEVLQEYWLVPDLYLVRVAPDKVDDAIESYRNDPAVLYAEQDGIDPWLAIPNDPMFPAYSWEHWSIRAPRAWDTTTGAPAFAVGHLDSGVDYTHPDLAANVDLSISYDFYDHDSDPMDTFWHGTGTASVIAAVGDNAVDYVGTMWRCRIAALRVGPAGALHSAQIEAIQYMVAQGINVSNISSGSTTYTQARYDAMAAAQSVGHIFVCAAGNDGTNNDVSPIYPASYDLPNVVAVAAVGSADELSSYSCYGPTSVDLAAPGDDIAVADLGGQWVFESGTSFSAPMVAATIGLVRSHNPGLSWQAVKELIMGSARPVPALQGLMVSGAIVDAAAAITDCNGNGVPDWRDVHVYGAPDCDGNDVPDSCELRASEVALDYALDDGTAETAVGLAQAGTLLWLNGFEVMLGGEWLDAVAVKLGAGTPPGASLAVIIYADVDNDGNPNDLRQLASYYITVPADTTRFVRTPIVPLFVGNVGTRFFAGAVMDAPAQVYIADLDRTTSSQRSWVVGYAPGFVDVIRPYGLVTVDSVGLSGNWLIRVHSGRNCNYNGVPDDCEWQDCNGNLQLDACDVTSGTRPDCNWNGIPDECDIASGSSADIDDDGVPDECEDCNGNRVPDQMDIAGGASPDSNGDGVPDECQFGRPAFAVDAGGTVWTDGTAVVVGQSAIGVAADGGITLETGVVPCWDTGPAICRGDTNCDGVISYGDINPFVVALNSLSTWQAQNPGCPWQNVDTNDDGVISYGDINPFVVLLNTHPPCP